VEIDRDVQRALRNRHTGYVIDVRVRQKNVSHRELFALGKRQ
jgi:hypothetical protein